MRRTHTTKHNVGGIRIKTTKKSHKIVLLSYLVRLKKKKYLNDFYKFKILNYNQIKLLDQNEIQDKNKQ